MTRREHQIRREILDKLEARIAEDPFFRLYELGIEAGRLLSSAGDHALELERNYREARELIFRCTSRAAVQPPPNCSCSL